MNLSSLLSMLVTSTIMGAAAAMSTDGNIMLGVAVLSAGALFTLGVMAICERIRDSMPPR